MELESNIQIIAVTVDVDHLKYEHTIFQESWKPYLYFEDNCCQHNFENEIKLSK